MSLTDQHRIEIAADNCEVLRARLAKYEDDQGNPKATPSAKWKADGEPDPHAGRYECERAKLAMGDLTDDELANGAFMNYDAPLNLAGILAGTHSSPIAWMTAVKDRIRWLSRSLEQARAALSAPNHGEQVRHMVPAGWKLVPVEPTPEMLASVTTSKHEALRAEVMRMAATDYRLMLAAAPSAGSQEKG